MLSVCSAARSALRRNTQHTHTHLPVERPQAPSFSWGHTLQIDHISLFEAQLFLACTHPRAAAAATAHSSAAVTSIHPIKRRPFPEPVRLIKHTHAFHGGSRHGFHHQQHLAVHDNPSVPLHTYMYRILGNTTLSYLARQRKNLALSSQKEYTQRTDDNTPPTGTTVLTEVSFPWAAHRRLGSRTALCKSYQPSQRRGGHLWARVAGNVGRLLACAAGSNLKKIPPPPPFSISGPLD